MTSFKWLWSISTVQQESAHCPHTHTYSQMHQQTNKLVNQIWTETITRHWWSPVISAAFLLFISVMIIRGLTSTRHFCNQPSHNIFLQHDRSCCHVNFRGFFFFAATSRYSEKQLLCFSTLQLFNLWPAGKKMQLQCVSKSSQDEWPWQEQKTGGEAKEVVHLILNVVAKKEWKEESNSR